MHVFTCQNCGQLLHFENVVCMRCGMTLGFLPAALTLSALDLAPSGDRWTARADGGDWRQCANLREAGCNWMVPRGERGRVLPVLRPQPHDPRPVGGRQRGTLAGARSGEAAADLCAEAARAAAGGQAG